MSSMNESGQYGVYIDPELDFGDQPYVLLGVEESGSSSSGSCTGIGNDCEVELSAGGGGTVAVGEQLEIDLSAGVRLPVSGSAVS